MAGQPDPKPSARVRDPDLLKNLHGLWRACALASTNEEGERCEPILSLHHIHRHPRDDVEANLVMLCGSGTTGHHGSVTAHERWAVDALRAFLRSRRPDTLRYLAEKLGGREAAAQWLRGGL